MRMERDILNDLQCPRNRGRIIYEGKALEALTK